MRHRIPAARICPAGISRNVDQSIVQNMEHTPSVSHETDGKEENPSQAFQSGANYDGPKKKRTLGKNMELLMERIKEEEVRKEKEALLRKEKKERKQAFINATANKKLAVAKETKTLIENTETKEGDVSLESGAFKKNNSPSDSMTKPMQGQKTLLESSKKTEKNSGAKEILHLKCVPNDTKTRTKNTHTSFIDTFTENWRYPLKINEDLKKTPSMKATIIEKNRGNRETAGKVNVESSAPRKKMKTTTDKMAPSDSITKPMQGQKTFLESSKKNDKNSRSEDILHFKKVVRNQKSSESFGTSRFVKSAMEYNYPPKNNEDFKEISAPKISSATITGKNRENRETAGKVDVESGASRKKEIKTTTDKMAPSDSMTKLMQGQKTRLESSKNTKKNISGAEHFCHLNEGGRSFIKKGATDEGVIDVEVEDKNKNIKGINQDENNEKKRSGECESEEEYDEWIKLVCKIHSGDENKTEKQCLTENANQSHTRNEFGATVVGVEKMSEYIDGINRNEKFKSNGEAANQEKFYGEVVHNESEIIAVELKKDNKTSENKDEDPDWPSSLSARDIKVFYEEACKRWEEEEAARDRTNKPVLALPSTPSDFRLVFDHRGNFILYWKHSTYARSCVTHYEAQVKHNDGEWRDFLPTEAFRNVLRVVDMRPGLRYKFRVRAITKRGLVSSYAVTREIKVPESYPTAPKVLRHCFDNEGFCRLCWKFSSHSGDSKIMHYVIQCKINSGEWKNTQKLKDNILKISDMKQGCRYKFRIMAVNESGRNSPYLIGTEIKVPLPRVGCDSTTPPSKKVCPDGHPQK